MKTNKYFSPGCFEEIVPQKPHLAKELQNSEYQIVNRFDNFGGGWGYSGHSVEAIRFSSDTDVMICKWFTKKNKNDNQYIIYVLRWFWHVWGSR